MAQSVGDGLENVVAGLGTSRDKMAHTHYTFTNFMDQNTAEAMYSGSWLAKRVVNTVAEDMTREWVQVIFDGEKDTQFSVEEAEKQFAVRAKFLQALTWARLYGGAALVIGVKGQDLAEPLDVNTITQGSLSFLHVLDRYRIAGSGNVILDLEDPAFGLPESYVLGVTSQQTVVTIHHTRVIRFDGEPATYQRFTANAYWHDSVLTHLQDAIKRADTVSAGIASMVFEANVDVITSEGLGELLSTKEGSAKVTKRYQMAATMKSFNRLLLLDSSETYDKKGNSFANLDEIWMRYMQEVSGAADIPLVRLLQTSPTGLNSTGDGELRNYYDMIKSKQCRQLQDQLHCLYEVLVRHALGYMPEDFRFEFKPLWQMSEAERASIQKTNADRDKIYLDAAIITEGLIAKELMENNVYPNMTQEDVDLAEELAKEPPEPPPGVDPLTGMPINGNNQPSAPPAGGQETPPTAGGTPQPGGRAAVQGGAAEDQ